MSLREERQKDRNPRPTLRFHDSKLVVKSHHGESKYAAPTWGNPVSRRYCTKVKHKPPPAESPATMISCGAMQRSAAGFWVGEPRSFLSQRQ